MIKQQLIQYNDDAFKSFGSTKTHPFKLCNFAHFDCLKYLTFTSIKHKMLLHYSQ